MGFPGGSDGEESDLQCGRPGFDPWVEDSLEEGVATHSCLENPYGKRSQAGYSPWGHKESDTTEQLSTAHSTI